MWFMADGDRVTNDGHMKLLILFGKSYWSPKNCFNVLATVNFRCLPSETAAVVVVVVVVVVFETDIFELGP